MPMSTATVALALAAMVVLAMADFSIKQSSGKISASVGTMIYALSALLISGLWVLWSSTQGRLEVTPTGVAWSVATGLCFGAFTGLLFVVFTTGANLSVAVPVIRMGGVVIVSALGVALLGEQLTPRHVIGLCLTLLGVYLLAAA